MTMVYLGNYVSEEKQVKITKDGQGNLTLNGKENDNMLKFKEK